MSMRNWTILIIAIFLALVVLAYCIADADWDQPMFGPRWFIVFTPMIVYWSWDPDIPLYDIVPKLRSIRLSRIGTLIR